MLRRGSITHHFQIGSTLGTEALVMTQAMTVEALHIFLGWLPPHIVEVLPSLIAVVVVSPLVVSSTKFHWSRSSVRHPETWPPPFRYHRPPFWWSHQIGTSMVPIHCTFLVILSTNTLMVQEWYHTFGIFQYHHHFGTRRVAGTNMTVVPMCYQIGTCRYLTASNCPEHCTWLWFSL